MVYNKADQPVEIDRIYLGGGEQSEFRVNINGRRKAVRDMILPGNDSMFVFVECNLNDGSNYLYKKDSVVFNVNGRFQHVDLTAWGRDINRVPGLTINKDTAFSSVNAFFIEGDIVVKHGATLTLDPGTEMYFTKNTGLLVEGTLKALGDFFSPVILTNARTDEEYEHVPGQWSGVQLKTSSTDNFLSHTLIENAVSGLVVGSPDSLVLAPGLEIRSCIIQNHTYGGLIAFNADILVVNNVIVNCGFYTGYFAGGKYDFYHTTIANYYPYRTRSTPGFFLSNQFNDEAYALDFSMYNSILWGTGEQLQLDDFDEAVTADYFFDHVMLKTDFSAIDTADDTHFRQIIAGVDPDFVDPEDMNFKIDSLSMARDKGYYQYGILYPFDIKEDNRTFDAAPDLGAYEIVDF